MMLQNLAGDGLHETVWNVDSESFEGVTLPSWEEIYYNCDGEELPETMVSFSDMSAALSIIIGWLCKSQRDEPARITTVGAKAEALLFWLDPNQSKYTSLTAIARACGLTKAAISKQLLSLKDQLGSAVSVGKLSSTRQTYRQAQIDCMERGT